MIERIARSTAVVVLSMLAACRGSPPPPAEDVRPPAEDPEPLPPAEPPERPEPTRTAIANELSVIVVTIDGVRWQDVFTGGDPFLAPNGELDAYADPLILAPRIHELSATGVALGAGQVGCGVVQAHGTSNLSLPGYLEILGGRATPCRSNACPRTDVPTVLDDANRAGLGPVASISSWETLERAASHGDAGVLVSAGSRSWPSEPLSKELAIFAEMGVRSGPYPAPGGAYRPDDVTARIALEYLRAASPRLLHVGLGDADEWAHRGNYVGYLNAIHAADTFIGELADLLEQRGTLASTVVMVTTDHGRARDWRRHGGGYPESRRAFLFAFGKVANPGTRCASRDVELMDVGATARALLGLPQPRGAPDVGRPIREVVEPKRGDDEQ